MTTKLPFIDRIKMLSRDIINGKNAALTRPLSYEVEILPSRMQKGSQQSPLSSVHAVEPGATVAALLVSGKADRLWSVNQESGREVEHTHSNLG